MLYNIMTLKNIANNMQIKMKKNIYKEQSINYDV